MNELNIYLDATQAQSGFYNATMRPTTPHQLLIIKHIGLYVFGEDVYIEDADKRLLETLALEVRNGVMYGGANPGEEITEALRRNLSGIAEPRNVDYSTSGDLTYYHVTMNSTRFRIFLNLKSMDLPVIVSPEQTTETKDPHVTERITPRSMVTAVLCPLSKVDDVFTTAVVSTLSHTLTGLTKDVLALVTPTDDYVVSIHHTDIESDNPITIPWVTISPSELTNSEKLLLIRDHIRINSERPEEDWKAILPSLYLEPKAWITPLPAVVKDILADIDNHLKFLQEDAHGLANIDTTVNTVAVGDKLYLVATNADFKESTWELDDLTEIVGNVDLTVSFVDVNRAKPTELLLSINQRGK